MSINFLSCFQRVPQDSTAFADQLFREQAFYFQSDYLEVTKQDFLLDEPLTFISYRWDAEGKITRAVRRVLMVVIFPWGLYESLHVGAAKYKLLTSASPSKERIREIRERRLNIVLDGDWKYKRITVEVNGNKIDAAIIGKISTLANGRWVLDSNGNNARFETKLFDDNCDLKKIITKIEASALVFNYPGVGSSGGFPGRKAMVKTYLAMLDFLVDPDKGIGAKEVVLYGHSMGAGIQGEALLKVRHPEIKLCIKSRSFSDLRSVVFHTTNSRVLGFAIKFLQWNIRSIESSKEIGISEIIMQTASVEVCQELMDGNTIIHDDKIPEEASLAKALLEDNDPRAKANKIFLALPEKHNEELREESLALLAEKIRQTLNNCSLLTQTSVRKEDPSEDCAI